MAGSGVVLEGIVVLEEAAEAAVVLVEGGVGVDGIEALGADGKAAEVPFLGAPNMQAQVSSDKLCGAALSSFSLADRAGCSLSIYRACNTRLTPWDAPVQSRMPVTQATLISRAPTRCGLSANAACR